MACAKAAALPCSTNRFNLAVLLVGPAKTICQEIRESDLLLANEPALR